MAACFSKYSDICLLLQQQLLFYWSKLRNTEGAEHTKRVREKQNNNSSITMSLQIKIPLWLEAKCNTNWEKAFCLGLKAAKCLCTIARNKTYFVAPDSFSAQPKQARNTDAVRHSTFRTLLGCHCNVTYDGTWWIEEKMINRESGGQKNLACWFAVTCCQTILVTVVVINKTGMATPVPVRVVLAVGQ